MVSSQRRESRPFTSVCFLSLCTRPHCACLGAVGRASIGWLWANIVEINTQPLRDGDAKLFRAGDIWRHSAEPGTKSQEAPRATDHQDSKQLPKILASVVVTFCGAVRTVHLFEDMKPF